MEEQNFEKSRTQVKNADRELQKLGERLLELRDDQLSRLDIPQELMEAVREARQIRSKQAKQRQIQYIGALMRTVDPEPLVKAFELMETGRSPRPAVVSKQTRWLEKLIGGDDALLEEIARLYPGSDRQKLRQLTRNARKSLNSPTAAKQSRALLAYLTELSQP